LRPSFSRRSRPVFRSRKRATPFTTGPAWPGKPGPTPKRKIARANVCASPDKRPGNLGLRGRRKAPASPREPRPWGHDLVPGNFLNEVSNSRPGWCPVNGKGQGCGPVRCGARYTFGWRKPVPPGDNSGTTGSRGRRSRAKQGQGGRGDAGCDWPRPSRSTGTGTFPLPQAGVFQWGRKMARDAGPCIPAQYGGPLFHSWAGQSSRVVFAGARRT